MVSLSFLPFLSLFLLPFLPLSTEACTSIAFGKGSVENDQTAVSQSNDAEGDEDYRVIYVPRRYKQHEHQTRPLFGQKISFPRQVNTDNDEKESGNGSEYDFSPEYAKAKRLPWTRRESTVVDGYIDEVEETYGYFDGFYGLQNEFQVGGSSLE